MLTILYFFILKLNHDSVTKNIPCNKIIVLFFMGLGDWQHNFFYSSSDFFFKFAKLVL